MKLNTLRARVVTWYVGLLAATLILFGAALYVGVQRYLRTSLEHSLAGEADAIAGAFVSQVDVKGADWMKGEIVEAYAPELSSRFIRISRQNGDVLYESGDTRDPFIDASAISHQGGRLQAPAFHKERQAQGSTVLLYSLPFHAPSGATFQVETGASLTPMEHVLSSLLRIVLLLTPLILAAAAVGGSMLMRVPLQPLLTLSERAESIGLSALGERLPVLSTGDEMERLSLSLNRMISRLEDALSQNRRFSADVSHELRTPLTIMRGELDQILLAADLPSSIRGAIGIALDENNRMAKIVDNLLTIARLDSGIDAIQPQPEDLGELCRWTLDQMHLLAEEKFITIQVEAHPAPVLANAARMKQVFVNLIDNAIKYTPAGGSIFVRAYCVDQNAVLEIGDNGQGIAADALPHIFDRFFRADKGRVRTAGGTGLGLSIVQAICHAHGGIISIRSVEGEGTVVRVELPRALASSRQRKESNIVSLGTDVRSVAAPV